MRLGGCRHALLAEQVPCPRLTNSSCCLHGGHFQLPRAVCRCSATRSSRDAGWKACWVLPWQGARQSSQPACGMLPLLLAMHYLPAEDDCFKCIYHLKLLHRVRCESAQQHAPALFTSSASVNICIIVWGWPLKPHGLYQESCVLFKASFPQEACGPQC